RLDPGVTMEFYKPRALTEDGFAKILKTPELVEQVATVAKPPMKPDDLARRVIVLNSGESEVFTLNLTAQTPQRAVELANLYAEEAKKFTAELQKREVADLVDGLKSQVAQMDGDLDAVTKQIRGAARTIPAPAQGITVREQLQKEEQELLRLRTTLQDAHPKVQQQLAVIGILKNQLT